MSKRGSLGSQKRDKQKKSSTTDSKVEPVEYLNTFPKLEYEKQESKDMKPPSALQKIFRCRNQPNSQYYFTSSRKEVETTRNVLNEQSPFWYPETLRQESYKAYSKARNEQIRKGNLNVKYYERDTYKSREMRDLRARLHIPEIPNDVRTIVDIDPDFFSIVDGRPIRYSFDKTEYVNDIKDIMLFKSLAGFRDDEILRMEEIIKDEEAKYADICKKYNQYVDSFEQFVLEDYTKSKGMLKKAEDLHNVLENKIEEYNNLSIQLGINRRKAYILEEKCRQAKMYQDFLYNISPTAWRLEHGLSEVGDLEMFDESSGAGMFGKYQMGSGDGTVASLTSIIDQFYQDKSIQQEPDLFFTGADQLLSIFRSIILQNMKSWMHCENLTDQLQKVESAVDIVKKRIAQEFNELEDIITSLESEIDKEETRAEELKDKALRIINTQYHDAVSSEYAVKFHVCVKDVYEKLIVSTVSFSTFEMLKTLQTEYEAIMMEMDGLDPECVNRVRKETFERDKRAMLLAYDASSKLKNLHSVHRTLMKNLDPPFKKVGKPVMFRSYLPKKKIKLPEI